MTKILNTLVGLIGVFWMALAGGYLVYWYDHRPTGVPAPIRLHVLFWSTELGLPPSLLAQRDAATQTYRAAVESSRTAILRAEKLQAEASARADAAQTALAAKIAARHDTLQKEIQYVLTPVIDRSFPLSVGLVRAHDAAASGSELSFVPPPPGLADGDPSPIKESQLAGTLNDNYTSCRLALTQLAGLKAWAVVQHEIKSGPVPPAQ